MENVRDKLKKAKVHMKRALEACNNEDSEEAVMWAFYAYENAVVAAAERFGINWKKTHFSKAQVARDLYKKKYLSIDVGDKIEEFNSLRKDVQYDEPGPDLLSIDLQDMAAELEDFIADVGKAIEGFDEE
ncbi:HEPN domain-containing protein [Candidatus Magnetominusculus dajiuhuensis]|uniref:HEPN domain-containing protein n=1 Tax=Candidatus Magnetominusculus dajiuhuensis TaxID=3137712 RepID=UPI003B4333CC